MSHSLPTLFCCIPLMQEYDNISSLYHTLKTQKTDFAVKIVCCVNQPLSWWNDDTKKTICENNQKTIAWLQAQQDKNLVIIDKSSSVLTYEHQGVGWARRLAMDKALELASEHDMLFSMDADTAYPEDFLEKTAKHLLNNSKKLGVSIDYYHPLAENEQDSRAMLRYEFFMRNYELNLHRIQSPYRFTAIGSGMACWVWAYKKIGGMPIKQAGEDFYFMQKLCKNGEILYANPVLVYPQPRHSDRVLFGTGPAIQSGIQGDWERYPIYSETHFNVIKKIYAAFEDYYTHQSLPEEVVKNLSFIFNQFNWVEKLKRNSTTKAEFMKKIHMKFDGLKILRLLKQLHQSEKGKSEEITLKDNLLIHYEKLIPSKEKEILLSLNFKTTSIEDMDVIRKRMFLIKQHYTNL